MQPNSSFRPEFLEPPHNSSQSQINTIATFPPSTQPFLSHRKPLIERSVASNGFFMQENNTSSIPFAADSSEIRHEVDHLGREVVSESSLASSAEKLQDSHGVPSVNPRYADSILIRFSSNQPGGGGGGLWPYAMRNDLSASSSSVQLPMHISSGEDKHGYAGAPGRHIHVHNTNISSILPVSSDQAGIAYAQNSGDTAWANEGTELLLLPGVSGGDHHHQHHHHHHHQAAPQGKISTKLKPLSEYLNPHADHEQSRQASTSFHGFATPSASSFRDLSLSLCTTELATLALSANFGHWRFFFRCRSVMPSAKFHVSQSSSAASQRRLQDGE